jgi:hypothetical protein
MSAAAKGAWRHAMAAAAVSMLSDGAYRHYKSARYQYGRKPSHRNFCHDEMSSTSIASPPRISLNLNRTRA